MAVTVTTKDRGLDALKKRLAGAKGRELTVGIHEEEGGAAHGGATVADVASFHEFGLGNPERSFIRAWADEASGTHQSDLRALGRALAKGKVASAEQGLEQLGEAYVGQVQSRISAGIAPANAPSTIAKKGSSTPLIDQGVLRSSITKRVS